jgi:hypothetical protein
MATTSGLPERVELPLALEGEIAEAVDNAYDDGRPVVLGYVDADGRPRLSFRGSTQVFDRERLAVWARNPEGGLPLALAERPHVCLIYRNPSPRRIYVVYGRARVVTDPEVGRRVYDRSTRAERDRDPERLGVAVLIDVDRVEGVTDDGPFLMKRA